MRVNFEKYKKSIAYLFFGGVTTFVNWTSYALFMTLISLGSHTIIIANIFSWVLSVLFSFCVNKQWVFESKDWRISTFFKEFGKFSAVRLLVGIFECFLFPQLIHIGIDQKILGIEGMAAKLLVNVIVVVLNYILSKFFVYSNQGICK